MTFRPEMEDREWGAEVRETIVAISTAPGRGGIGIVRLSGPEALRVAERLVTVEGEWEHARARLVKVVDVEGGGG